VRKEWVSNPEPALVQVLAELMVGWE